MEVLIVMIIIGVLASVAMPQLFSRIESARAAEAMESIGAVKHAIEACAMPYNNDFSSCFDFTTIGMTNPSYNATTNAGSHFGYTFTTAATSFQIVATRNTTDNGTATHTITMSRASNGAITRAGTTAFSGIQ